MGETARTGSAKSKSVHPLIERALAGEVPVAHLIGFDLQEFEAGRAVLTLRAGPHHANPMGTLHGGVLCDVADAAMGLAFATTLAADESFTTVSLDINFFRPVWEATLRAEGRVVNRGRNAGYVECDVADPDGRLIARAHSTCFILRGEQAKGR